MINYSLYLSELTIRFNACQEKLLAFEQANKEVLEEYEKLLDEHKAILSQLRELAFSSRA